VTGAAEASDRAVAADRRRRAQGQRSDALQAEFMRLDLGAARWADDFVFGEVWGRPGLAHEERMIVAITALAAQGNTNQLRNYLFGAVQDGVPPRKIHEALVMLVVYVGFPTALGALAVWRDVRESCARRGIELAGLEDVLAAEGAASMSGSNERS
jgi:4-carboxymuconolactone decarboxylase